MTEKGNKEKIIQRVFFPAIALMNRMAYSKKFALLGLMSLIAIVVALYSLFAALDRVILTSQKELEGLAFIKPFSLTLQFLQQHRGLSAGLLSGDEAGMREPRAAVERKVAGTFSALERALSPNLRASEGFQQIKKSWESLRTEGLHLTVDENFAAHTLLISQILVFEVVAADEYALTLDPDLDTFYMIDTMIDKLPKALEYLAQIRGYGAGILARKRVTEREKVEMNTLIAILGSTLQHVNLNLDKVRRHRNPETRNLISATAKDIVDTSQQVIDLAKTNIILGRFAISPSDFFWRATVAIDTDYRQLHESLLPTCKNNLKLRIATAENELRAIVGIASALFLVVLYFSAGICCGLAGNIQLLALSAHAFARGNLSERVHLDTHDELSQVGNSFNEMADGFVSLLEARREDSARLSAAIETAMDAVVSMDSQGLIVGWNGQAENIFGWSRAEAVGQALSETIVPPQHREAHVRGVKRFLRSGILNLRIDAEGLHRDGRIFPVELAVSRITIAGRCEFSAFIRDITERKLAQQNLAESEQRFRGLVEQPIAGIYIIQDARLAYVNPRFAEILGYDSADELIGIDPLSIVAQSDRDAVAKAINIKEGDPPNVSYGFTARRKDGAMIYVGTHGVLAAHRGRTAIMGLMQDITDKKIAEEQAQRYVNQVKGAFMRTVGVATTMSEMRDPYTVGHERRVAHLAVAIGSELGLDEQRLEGLRVAGYLHDIGKIMIPSEILSKPGRLSRSELTLVREHVQASYDILQGVDFPWPTADVVLQHHERMDGSGYPNGLKGDKIELEARILSVADVVEAISSHRPYRPGLGIEKGLMEIKHGRGAIYDPCVVDACLRQFHDKGYKLPAN